MFLQKLELNGFKSFAKKTTLEFNPGITSIVGPNGSGKSNVAEAVRWVMGEQSAKSLRGKQSTDVIFSGSDKSSKLGLAEVSLFFNNQGGQAPLEYSEVELRRRIHRDGHSDYFINGQPARLQDILLLLAQINLSSKTYSVIGQGMVDDILNVTPLQRKDFFEEASGVKPLQIKKNEAVRKLEHTNENLQTVTIQLNELAPRLRSLTRQVKRLERRSEIESKLRDLQYHYYGKTLSDFQDQAAAARGRVGDLDAQIAGLEQQLKKLQSVMLALTKESSHSDQFSQAQADYDQLINTKADLKEEELQIKSELLQAERASQKTHVPISVVREVENRFEIARSKLASHRKLVKNHESLDDWRTWYVEFERLLAGFDDLLRPLQPFLWEHDLTEKETGLKKLQQQIVVIDEQLNEVQQRIKSLVELEKNEKVKIWQTQNELQELQKLFSSLVNQRNEQRVALARIETHLGDLQTEAVGEVGIEFFNRLQSWGKDAAGPDKGNSADNLKEQIHQLKHEIELIGGIDPEVQREYQEIKERYDFLDKQTQDLEAGVRQLQAVIASLEEKVKQQFNESFRRINDEFQKYFKMLFRGGRAELKLVKGAIAQPGQAEENTESVEAETNALGQGSNNEIVGVDIVGTPPGKKIKAISMLSGGERALTSIALIAAIIFNNPAPFVVLDEVDAALDEENSLRFAEIVAELAHKTQFIIITHNRATMEYADLLYGVTMGEDGISKLLSLKFAEAQVYTNR